jgi:hypothetical protein
MLREALISDGMPAWQAATYYQAVHRFGASAWNADAREGTFGMITSGDFIDQKSYDDWKAAGGTIFQPIGDRT